MLTRRSGSGKGRGLSRYGIDDGEDGQAGAEAEGQCRDGGAGKRRCLPEHPHRVAEVQLELVEDSESARLAAIERHVVDVAKLDPRAAPCGVARHTRGDEILDVALEVVPQFFGQALLELRASANGTRER